jgi:hypothetical protein
VPISAGGDLLHGELQPLCHGHCHQSIKRRLEAMFHRGEIGAADLRVGSAKWRELDRPMCRPDGYPSSPDHPWFRG